MVEDSAEILEGILDDERHRVSIRYYSMTHGREETITSCEGDLIVICNVLADYADLLDEFLKNDRERLEFCAIMQYERMRDRCQKITGELQKKRVMTGMQPLKNAGAGQAENRRRTPGSGRMPLSFPPDAGQESSRRQSSSLPQKIK